jgi:hypothetical protein
MSVNALANYLASLQQGEENHRTEIVYGEVMTIDPLSIRFGELNVTKPFLVPSKMYTPTEPGQKVMAIKTNGGQLYFVLHEKDFVVPDYYGLIEELEERLTKHTHDHITVPDNRNVVSVPSDLKGFAISADFKTNASAGSPPVTASDSYAHLINVAGYSSGEGSGGWPSQISVGDGLAVRQGSGAGSWKPWRKVWHDGNDGSGSGLDADLIKGKHFIVTDHTNGLASPDNVTANTMAYVKGTAGILGVADGALYSQWYSTNWIHQIYGDYRSGRLAVRGNLNGAWQPWMKIPVESDIYDDSEDYRLLKGKGGTTGSYVRTPQAGIIPYATSNSSDVGTFGWPFRSVYANTIYEGGTSLANKYAPASQIGNLALLTTNHKSTLVGATNELKGRVDTVEAKTIMQLASITSVPGQSYTNVSAPYPTGFTPSNCAVIAMARSTLDGFAIVPYRVSHMVDVVHITFATVPGGNFTAVETKLVNILFVKI